MTVKLKDKKATPAEKQDAAVKEAVKDEAKKGPPKKAKLTEEQLCEKYPHAVPGTLKFDEAANKQTMEIECVVEGCTNRRTVYTSDLWQVKKCLDHKKEERTAARKVKADKKAEEAKADTAEAAPEAEQK
jgi:hypothetical protein